MTPESGRFEPRGVWLDQSAEPWTGHIAGLGNIAVDDRGGCSTHPAIGADVDEANRTLASGWADLLSWVRRGYRLGNAVCVSDPLLGDQSLLLRGDTAETSQATLSLISRGWHMVSDRPTPLAWLDGGLVGFPRPEPLIVGSHIGRTLGLVTRPVRSQSDAVTVDVPRAVEPTTIRATATLEARRPGDSSMTELTGTSKFEVATRIILMGVLTPIDYRSSSDDMVDPHLHLAEHVRLSALPSAVIRTTDIDDTTGIDSLVEWWRRVVGS